MFYSCPSCGAENLEGSQYCNLCFSTLGFGNADFWANKREIDNFRKTLLPEIINQKVVDAKLNLVPKEGIYELTADLIEIEENGEITGAIISEPVPNVYPVKSLLWKKAVFQERRATA